MALNTDYALRTGAYDHTGEHPESLEAAQQKALERYLAVKGSGPEKLATGSDDFTIMLWEPSSNNKKPLERLTGHGKLINVVCWSPDGRLLASASFDKNIKLWTAAGKFITTFRGHVGEVYQLCWSSDSRMIVSGSKDSTMKVWDVRTRKLKEDLPGHADEVYSVDWSPDGERVASGSKDRLLKMFVRKLCGCSKILVPPVLTSLFSVTQLEKWLRNACS
jgi:ribosome assembly protein 4